MVPPVPGPHWPISIPLQVLCRGQGTAVKLNIGSDRSEPDFLLLLWRYLHFPGTPTAFPCNGPVPPEPELHYHPVVKVLRTDTELDPNDAQGASVSGTHRTIINYHEPNPYGPKLKQLYINHTQKHVTWTCRRRGQTVEDRRKTNRVRLDREAAMFFSPSVVASSKPALYRPLLGKSGQFHHKMLVCLVLMLCLRKNKVEYNNNNDRFYE